LWGKNVLSERQISHKCSNKRKNTIWNLFQMKLEEEMHCICRTQVSFLSMCTTSASEFVMYMYIWGALPYYWLVGSHLFDIILRHNTIFFLLLLYIRLIYSFSEIVPSAYSKHPTLVLFIYVHAEIIFFEIIIIMLFWFSV